jgi:acyl-CoA synthetase (AMP-forming)/AMP-acid ligase II
VTIATLLQMAASADPDRLAVGSLSFGELQARVSAMAGRLRTSGASSLAFVGMSSEAWPVALFGCAEAGIPLIPLNYRLSPSQLQALVRRLDSPLVAADARYAHAFDDSGITSLDAHDLASGGPADTAPSAQEPLGETDPDGVAVVLFTSGTTAEPRGVILRHTNLLSYVVQTVEFASAGPDECALVSVPPYHVAGVGTVLTNCYAGRHIRYLPDFDPARWLEAVRSDHVTQAMLVPTMLARIVEHLGTRRAATPTLRSIAYGGAAMPPGVLQRALEIFPDVAFVHSYGLTETSSTVAVLSPQDHREAAAASDDRVRKRLGSAGRAVPGVEFRIVDVRGAPLPAGEPGELQVRGPQVSGEYLGESSALDGDGWFATRDRARLDDDGFLYVLGRLDDTIIRGAENISPAEIEAIVAAHPLVRDVGVVGVADQEWGQRSVAVVVTVTGANLTADELRSWVRARARGSRTPDEVIFQDALPYNTMGKLLRRELLPGNVQERGSP